VTGTLTVDLGDSAGATINSGAAKVLTIGDLSATATTIVAGYTGTAATPMDINLDDTADETTNNVTISAAGQVTLDHEGATGSIETLTLKGNGAAVTYTIDAAATAADKLSVTAAGDQSVTVSVAGADVNGETWVDTTTAGTFKVIVNSDAADIDLSKIGADVLDIGTDAASRAITFKTGAKANISVDQGAGTTTLTAAAATATTNTITVSVNNNDTDLDDTITLTADAFTNFEDIYLVAEEKLATVTSINFGTGADVFISGAKDVTFGTAATAVTVTADTIDASQLTGAFSISLGAAVDTVTSGSGNDTFVVGNDSTFVLDANGGTDTIVFNTDAANFADNTFSFDDFEVIALDNQDTDNDMTVTIASSDLTGKTLAVTGTEGAAATDEDVLQVYLDARRLTCRNLQLIPPT